MDPEIQVSGTGVVESRLRRPHCLIGQFLLSRRTKHFIGDLVAGLTVGLTVIPQGMAYAQIAELPPQVN